MTDDELIARILYRDGSVLIVDKPAGIPVHAGFGGGETLDQHFPALQFGLPNPPQLGHRLDKDTSGCLALGRHRRAVRELGEIFAGQKAQKTYLAVVLGHLPGDEGRVDAPLAKVSHEKRSWWMKVDPSGQPSVTDYRVIARGDRLTVVDLMPRTGRTHQLRVHMAHLGCPIVGDGVYGGDAARSVDRNLHLHARQLELPYYRKKPPILAQAPVPAHMLRLLGRLGAVNDEGALLHLPINAAPDFAGRDVV
ncbi:RluA family pseudouridine synthase [Pleomorphomonas sp. NRK KF1]|uniref:RluA family pseudouridine synthase n=1 Tax=Pleomorphomonas sp. NRK KF1 TaxID=2943000 RepID=UPI002042D30D|nr:RNA pseudouridine synthase [Pleomorphomonas sp. NRK KF1]MCM5554589.1 RNA pseudouridine synthase [Pleomorphomonas sp. NRK KF1]